MGETSTEIWDAIMRKEVGYRAHEQGDKTVTARFFGFMQEDKARYKGFPKAILKMLPRFAKNALVASREAVNMAFKHEADMNEVYSPFERGVIVGTGWGGLDDGLLNHDDYRRIGVSSSFSTVMSMSSIATAAISMNYQARGYQNTAIAACAAGTMAIGDAYEVIRSGRAKLMLAGGSEALKIDSAVWAIDVIQALSKEQSDVRRACCPFSAARSGFILSEGAAILCLEEYDSAIKRGARILGEIVGYGNFTDASDITAPAEDMLARVAAIQKAVADAGLSADEIDYVNAHGTSTPMNDINESESIKLALGKHAYAIPVTSTKSYTGHLIGAAGAIESVFCLKALESSTVPGTNHLDEPDPACDLNYLPNQHSTAHPLNAVMNLSFGFGGANCAVIFKKVQ